MIGFIRQETVLPITFDEQALQSALESLDATAFPTEVCCGIKIGMNM